MGLLHEIVTVLALYAAVHAVYASQKSFGLSHLNIFASKAARFCHSLLDITIEEAGLRCSRRCCSSLLAVLLSSLKVLPLLYKKSRQQDTR